MSYSSQNQDAKILPSLEHSMKSISWHLKVISENLAKLTQHLTQESPQPHPRGTDQGHPRGSGQPYNSNSLPF